MTGWSRWVAVCLILVATLLAACESEPESEGEGDSVVAMIIESGYAASVEVSGDGQTLIAYVEPPEDDEGTYRSAWRLYDESDQAVAEGRGVQVDGGSPHLGLLPLAEGFLIRRPSYARNLERIDPRGVVTQVRPIDASRATRAGDVLVSDPSQARVRFYRPSDDVTYRPPELPRGFRSIAIDRAGGVWLAFGGDDPATFYSRDGRRPWRELDFEHEPRSFPGRLQTSGTAVLLPLIADVSGVSSLTGLLIQEIDAPGDWRRVELAGVDGRGWTDPEVAVAGPGRLLLGESGRRWYLWGGGEWTRIALPDPQPHEDFSLEVKGERIFSRATQRGGLEWSDDLGRTWHNFAP